MLREQGTLTGGEANTVAELEAKKKMLGASDLTIDAIRKIVVDLDKRFGTGTLKAEGGEQKKERSVVKTGTYKGRSVVQYSDGSIEYAD